LVFVPARTSPPLAWRLTSVVLTSAHLGQAIAVRTRLERRSTERILVVFIFYLSFDSFLCSWRGFLVTLLIRGRLGSPL
jgi:hypothetical protein